MASAHPKHHTSSPNAHCHFNATMATANATMPTTRLIIWIKKYSVSNVNSVGPSAFYRIPQVIFCRLFFFNFVSRFVFCSREGFFNLMGVALTNTHCSTEDGDYSNAPWPMDAAHSKRCWENGWKCTNLSSFFPLFH